MAADVADWASTQNLATETTDWAGSPDVLVVTAGAIQPAGKVWEVSPDQWAGCVQVNLVGAFNTLRAFLPDMVAGAASAGGAPPRGATVVLVSTGVTRYVVPGWSAYGAAKSGLDYLGRNLQAELDLEGLPISVYTVYPGVVDTPMQETIRGMTPEEFPDVERIRRMHEEGQSASAGAAGHPHLVAGCPRRGRPARPGGRHRQLRYPRPGSGRSGPASVLGIVPGLPTRDALLVVHRAVHRGLTPRLHALRYNDRPWASSKTG